MALRRHCPPEQNLKEFYLELGFSYTSVRRYLQIFVLGSLAPRLLVR